MLTQIINGRILTPEGWLDGGSVLIDGNQIVNVVNTEQTVKDIGLAVGRQLQHIQRNQGRAVIGNGVKIIVART